MKILMISNLYPSTKYPHYGSFVKNFEDSMVQKGCDLSTKVVLRKQETTLLKIYHYLIFYLRIIKNVLHKNYDFIYVHYINHTLLPFYFIKWNISKPLILNAHGSDIYHESSYSKLFWFFAKKVIKCADLIVVPSNYFKGVIQSELNISEDKFFISPSAGINANRFHNLKQEFHTNKYNIGYLGRIDSGKGYDTLLSALAILLQSKKLYKLKVVGNGNEIDRFWSIIKKLQLRNYIDYNDLIPQQDVPNFFKQIDLLIFPSRRKGESLGLVPIEALACGTPVVALKNGAVEDYINDGVNGFLYNKDDPSQLANSIQKYFKQSPIEINDMIDKAGKIVEKYDSLQVSTKLYKKLSEYKS